MLPKHDRNILRDLGMQKAEIGALPVHQERRALWTKLNGLHSERPMVWIFKGTTTPLGMGANCRRGS